MCWGSLLSERRLFPVLISIPIPVLIVLLVMLMMFVVFVALVLALFVSHGYYSDIPHRCAVTGSGFKIQPQRSPDVPQHLLAQPAQSPRLELVLVAVL